MTPPGAPTTVSVVIVSWQSARFLPGCLDSIEAQSHLPADVIVVDNGSTDGSDRLVRERYGWARLVALGENTGYCRANNEGLARCSGEAVLFLNPDILLAPDYLARTMLGFERDERVGSVSGRLLRFDRRTVDTAGQCLSRGRRVVERGYGRPDGEAFRTPGYVFSVCGAAALYRRRCIEDLRVEGEFFDPDFFAFSEDLDIGWRARNAGWRAFYEPEAVALHFRGGSDNGASHPLARHAALFRRPPEIRYHILKNRYLMLVKNDRPAHLLRDLPFVLAREAALAGAALASGPSVLARLARLRPLLRQAARRRRAFLAGRGVWGRRSCGLPRDWAGERLLAEEA